MAKSDYKTNNIPASTITTRESEPKEPKTSAKVNFEQELLQLNAIKEKLSSVMDEVNTVIAKLSIMAASGNKKKPVVLGYKYIDNNNKEGFVPEGKNAEFEARKHSKDGAISYGYAYKDGDKFTGFVAIPSIN